MTQLNTTTAQHTRGPLHSSPPHNTRTLAFIIKTNKTPAAATIPSPIQLSKKKKNKVQQYLNLNLLYYFDFHYFLFMLYYVVLIICHTYM